MSPPFEVIPLHPTFAAEIKGVDFTQPISPELYAEIRKEVDKVRLGTGLVG